MFVAESVREKEKERDFACLLSALRSRRRNPRFRELLASSAANMNTEREKRFGSYSEVKVEKEESLSQWLHPSKVPLSYLALLNEESTVPDEKPPLDYVVEKLVLPSLDAAATGAGGGIRTLYSASENDGKKMGTSKVKPSIHVQSRTNNETSGSSSKVSVRRRSSRKSVRQSSQTYSEKLRSWKERVNNNNNRDRDFSQVYGKYRDVPSKQSNRNKKKTYTTELERKLRIEENISTLRELLPHEVEDTPETVMNDIIAHVKLLQLQFKELTRSRLGGEPISQHLISIEGHGHYIHHEKTITKPLEDMMADLLANDQETADSLLETKGLYSMPLDFAHTSY